MNMRALFAITAAVAIAAVGTIGAGAAVASPTPTEYFTIAQTSPAGPQTLVAAGPLSATGTVVAISNHKDHFLFPNGAVTTRHTKVTSRSTYDSRTCTYEFSESGTYVVGGGTGAYAHTTGSGSYTLHGVVQNCDPSQLPTAFAIVVQAHGPLDLG